MRKILVIVTLTALSLTIATSAMAKPNREPSTQLGYGETATPGKTYSVRTTLFGCTSWDDNGIGFFGGTDLFKLQWGVAELGFRGGTTGTAMGGIRGGTIAIVTNPATNISARVVFADVGGGHNYYQLDLHCGVAKAIGFWDTGRVQIRITNRRVNLSPRLVDHGIRGLGIIPATCLRTMQPCKKKKQSTR
jgi:hypothetical protein